MNSACGLPSLGSARSNNDAQRRSVPAWELPGHVLDEFSDALYVIAGIDTTKGLAVKDELDDYSGSEINHGRLYPNLDTLVEKGLIDKGKIDDRTNQYSLTTRGRREIEARRGWEEAYVKEVVEAA